jgi:hypothetical protein
MFGQSCFARCPAHSLLNYGFVYVMAVLDTRVPIDVVACRWEDVLPAPLAVGVGVFACQSIRERRPAEPTAQIFFVLLLHRVQVVE